MIVAPSLDIIGGQATQAAILRDRFARERCVKVCFQPTNPRLPGMLRRLQSIKYVRTLFTSALYIAALIARTPSQDVVHVFAGANSSFLISATPPILIARLLRKGTVLHYHSGEADSHLRRWRRTAPPTLRLVDAIAVPSWYLSGQFARHGINTRVVLNTLEADRFTFRERRPPTPIFLSNRQLLPYCNVACVLRAFALVEARVEGARLIVAADGAERPKLETLARDLSLRGVDFVGWVAPDRVGELYNRADIYLNASNHGDNIPMSILEAFASGAPVVSTDVAGIAELVRDGRTGLLVAPDNHEQLAAAAITLLDQPELATRLAQAARQECDRFTWASVRGEWLELYESLVGRQEVA